MNAALFADARLVAARQSGEAGDNALEIEREEDVVKLVVAVIPEDPLQTTVNLKVPIIINHKRMAGKQIVLCNSDYDTHQPLVFGDPSEGDRIEN